MELPKWARVQRRLRHLVESKKREVNVDEYNTDDDIESCITAVMFINNVDDKGGISTETEPHGCFGDLARAPCVRAGDYPGQL